MPSLLVTLALPASAATLNVPADHTTVTAAVAVAVDGDLILVAPGDFGTEPQVSITHALTLRGTQGADETTLPLLSIGGGASVVLENATLACPTVTEPSIYVAGSSLRLTGIIGRGCTGNSAILAFASPALIIEDSTFEQWTAAAGPVLLSSASVITLRRVTTSTTAAVGGNSGIFNESGHGGVVASQDDVSLHLEGCVFDGASAADRGGAIYAQGTTTGVTVVDTAFTGATADEGGAVYLGTAGAVSLAGLTVSDSVSAAMGAVAVRQATSLTVDRARFVGNGPALGGAALFASGGTATVTRSLFCDNAGAVADVDLLDATASVTATGFANTLGTALRATASELTVTNATFAHTTGSAISLATSGLTVRNSAFSEISGNAIEGTPTTPQPTGGYLAYDTVGAWLVGTGWASDALDSGSLANTPPDLQGEPADCRAESLWLAADSALRDVGDPILTDVDGTRSDIGMFGGPWADLVDGDEDGFSLDRDCDDDDAQSHPGADELPYDGIDQDCDGLQVDDLDGDGFDGGDGPDCDDADSAINPSADDPDADGVDRDCDGFDGLPVDTDPDTSDDEPRKCGCDAQGAAPSALLGIALLALLRRRPRS